MKLKKISAPSIVEDQARVERTPDRADTDKPTDQVQMVDHAHRSKQEDEGQNQPAYGVNQLPADVQDGQYSPLIPYLKWALPLLALGGGLALLIDNDNDNEDDGDGDDSSSSKPVDSLKVSNDTGLSSSDGVTQSATILIDAPAQGSTRSFSLNGGAATSSYTAPTADGSYTLKVTDTAADGAVASKTIQFTLDRNISAPSLKLSNDTEIAGDLITQDASLSVSSLETGGQRLYKVDNGAWTSTYTAPSSLGAHEVTVLDTDVAGNSASSSLQFTIAKPNPIDTTVPATPTVTLSQDTGSSSTDLLTNLAAITTSALATGVGRIYELTGPDGKISRSSTYSAPSIDGLYTLKVIDTLISSGISREASMQFNLDQTAPNGSLSNLRIVNDYGSSNTDGITNDSSFTYQSSIKEVTSSWVQVDGQNPITLAQFPSLKLTNGAHSLQVLEVDAAGNSVASNLLNFTLHRQGLTAPQLNFDASQLQSEIQAPIALGISGSDPASVIHHLQSYADSSKAMNTSIFNGGTISLPTTAGFYDLRIIDSDQAGNQVSSTNGLSLGLAGSTGHTLNDIASVGSVLLGGAGNDSIVANGGTDWIHAGAGSDLIRINSSNLTELLNSQTAATQHAIVNGGAGADYLLVDADQVVEFGSLANSVHHIEYLLAAGILDVGSIAAADVAKIASTGGLSADGWTGLNSNAHQLAIGHETSSDRLDWIYTASQWTIGQANDPTGQSHTVQLN